MEEDDVYYTEQMACFRDMVQKIKDVKNLYHDDKFLCTYLDGKLREVEKNILALERSNERRLEFIARARNSEKLDLLKKITDK